MITFFRKEKTYGHHHDTTTTPSPNPSVTGATKPLKTARQPKLAANRAAQPVAEAKSAALEKPTTEKPAQVKKPKLVRDRFTIPKSEYNVLDELKQRADKLAQKVKNSELLRAGVLALAAMPDGAFLSALNAVLAIKAGNPKKQKKEICCH